MVNSEFVLKLMEFYNKKPKNFPRVLNAIIRRELLVQISRADEEIHLIEDETEKDSRGKYIGEHLSDLADSLLALEEFLQYFRDIPLKKDDNGCVTSGEDIRMILGDLAATLALTSKSCYRQSWKMVSDEEFAQVRKDALTTANDIRDSLYETDRELMLLKTEFKIPEPIPDPFIAQT